MSSFERPGPTARRSVVVVSAGQASRKPDALVTEEPLEIRVSWPGHEASRAAVTMRTPGADFELATGFLLAEGVIHLGEVPRKVAYCVDRALSQEQRYNVVTVELERPPHRHPSSRTTSVSSACGVCGAESLDEVFTPNTPPVGLTSTVDAAVVSSLPDRLRERQPLFSRTGSIHACGVFDYTGELIVCREDIGRHNTVDKVMGARQLGAVAFDEDAILCVSGRIGFDIVTKAVSGRVSVIVAVGGPSSLAVELADRAGITVCGFARGDRFVIYTYPERISGV